MYKHKEMRKEIANYGNGERKCQCEKKENSDERFLCVVYMIHVRFRGDNERKHQSSEEIVKESIKR